MSAEGYRTEKAMHTLYPGEIYVTNEDVCISTVLGSCIAVCMWDPGKLIGGMNHVMLPVAPDGEHVSSKYGNVATLLLCDMLQNKGANTSDLEVKVFGGAGRFSPNPSQSPLSVGEQNLEITLMILERFHMPVKAQDTGGDHGRRILFDVSTGVVRVQTLQRFNFSQENTLIKGGE